MPKEPPQPLPQTHIRVNLAQNYLLEGKLGGSSESHWYKSDTKRHEASAFQKEKSLEEGERGGILFIYIGT